MATAKKSGAGDEASAGFTAAEKAAMKDRAAELRSDKSAARGVMKAAADLQNVLDRIAEMPEKDRVVAERVHELVIAAAPDLAPKTWYGMPAYAKDGKVLCFFQGSDKFESRYCTLGFSDGASLDDGTMWPTAYALTVLTAADEQAITALVQRAVG
jgi:uncharacterized protein YdhG (YjbR/CyaY superfamily)